MNYAISVIIPVYNVEKYIAKCLDSVISQKLEGRPAEECIEIIVVDDGTPDDSIKIIKQYVRKYKNITLLRQPNSGQSSARNNALKIASGEYIYFLDSDDLLPPNALTPLYKLAKETQSEVVIAQSKAFNNRRSWFIDDHAEVASAAFRKVKFTHRSILIKTSPPWAKLFKKQLIEKYNITFPEGIKLAEDWIFVIHALYRANHISTTPDITYLYQGRDDENNPSCTQIVNEKVFNDLLIVYELTKQFNLPDPQIRYIKIFILKSLLYRLGKFSKDNSFTVTKPIYKSVRSFIKNEIGYSMIGIFTPERRLLLTLIFHGFYSEAYRVANEKIKRSCLRRGKKINDATIIKDYLSIVRKNRFTLTREIKTNILNKYRLLGWWLKFNIAKFIAAKSVQKNNIVLVGERLGQTANDTSYYYFKHTQEKKSTDLAHYFVIEKNAETIKNLAPYKNVVHYGSLKHFIIFHKAAAYIFSDSMRDVLHQWRRVSHQFSDKKKVFLQHGIFATSRAKGYYDKNSMQRRNELPDKFIVSSDFEKKLICEQFGFENNEVSVTGLSRFDSLPKFRKKTNNQILILLTWRDWLSQKNATEFEKSQYFKKIYELITHPKLISFIQTHKTKIIMCLHHKMHKHLNMLDKSIEIEMVQMNNTDIQQLIIKSDLMVTDYSSTSFDMLYQKKPVLFYWFDQQQFFASRGGPLVCPINGIPGPILNNANDLINTIIEYKNNNFKISQEQLRTSRKFFSHTDNNNSMRIEKTVSGLILEHT